MQNKHRVLFLSLAGILAALLLSVPSIPVSGDGNAGSGFYESRQDKLTSGSKQASACMAILMEAAKQAGVKGTPRNVSSNVSGSGNQDCSVPFVVSGTGDPPPDATSTLLLLSETSPTNEESCKFEPQEQFLSTTFHGYNAETSYRKGETRMVNDVPYTFEGKLLEWCMHKGGRNHYITIYTTTQSIEKYGPAQDPLPIANVLWSIAEDRLPLSEAPADGVEQPSLPVVPGEVVPGQPGVPVVPGEVIPGQPGAPIVPSTPTETGGLFRIPLAVILGSLGIPVVGAVAGAVLSAILSGLSSASVSSASVSSVPVSSTPVSSPEVTKMNEDEWAQINRDQDREWTDHGGWQTKAEQAQSKQWDDNNRKATDHEDAELRAKREAELKALEEKDAELDKDRVIRKKRSDGFK